MALVGSGTVEIGKKAIDFTFDTPFEQGLRLSDEVKKAARTYLVFLRYYGCTLCQLDMRDYADAYEQFKAKNAQLLIVLQSDPAAIREQIAPDHFPYTIICDPEQKIYATYEVKAAKSKLGLASLALPGKMKRAKAMGVEHGAYEGNELQLPAVFLLGSEMNVLYSHRAKNVTDMPSIETMLGKL